MPDEPKLHPTIISAAFTRQVSCILLYDQFRRQLGTNRVSITVQGCKTDGEPYKGCPVIQVPSVDKHLSEVCPIGYNFYQVKADYTEGRLLPDALMTRGQFLLELLEIWGTMKNRLSSALSKTTGAELDLVMEYTKNVYSVNELIDLTYMENGHENEVAPR